MSGALVELAAKARRTNLHNTRAEGAEKALFHLACKLETLGFPAPLEGEHPMEWMGRYKALVDELVHMTADEIERGRLSLSPLPKARGRS